MNGKVWRETADQSADADVLNDRRVHACRDDVAQIIARILELIRKYKSVERDVAANTATMQKRHQGR